MKNKIKAWVLALGMLYGLSGDIDVKATTSHISSDLAKNLIENPIPSSSSDEMLDIQNAPLAIELPDYKTIKKQCLKKYIFITK